MGIVALVCTIINTPNSVRAHTRPRYKLAHTTLYKNAQVKRAKIRKYEERVENIFSTTVLVHKASKTGVSFWIAKSQ